MSFGGKELGRMVIEPRTWPPSTPGSNSSPRSPLSSRRLTAVHGGADRPVLGATAGCASWKLQAPTVSAPSIYRRTTPLTRCPSTRPPCAVAPTGDPAGFPDPVGSRRLGACTRGAHGSGHIRRLGWPQGDLVTMCPRWREDGRSGRRSRSRPTCTPSPARRSLGPFVRTVGCTTNLGDHPALAVGGLSFLS